MAGSKWRRIFRGKEQHPRDGDASKDSNVELARHGAQAPTQEPKSVGRLLDYKGGEHGTKIENKSKRNKLSKWTPSSDSEWGPEPIIPGPLLRVAVIGFDDEDEDWAKYSGSQRIDSSATSIRIKHYRKNLRLSPSAVFIEVQKAAPDMILLIYSPHSARSFEIIKEIVSSLPPLSGSNNISKPWFGNTTVSVFSVRRETCTNFPMYVSQDQGREFAQQLGVGFKHIAKEKYGFGQDAKPVGFGQYAKNVIVKEPFVFREVLGVAVKETWEMGQAEGVKNKLIALDKFKAGKKFGILEKKTEKTEETQEERTDIKTVKHRERLPA